MQGGICDLPNHDLVSSQCFLFALVSFIKVKGNAELNFFWLDEPVWTFEGGKPTDQTKDL